MLAPKVLLKIHNSMMNLLEDGQVLNLLQDATHVQMIWPPTKFLTPPLRSN